MLHLGYEIWICDRRKQRLPEYDIKLDGEDGRTMVCYIPSESGEEFQVRWKDHNSGPLANYTSMRVSVDGHAAGKTHCSPGSSNKRIGIRTASADKYQPFQFSELQTTDDDGALWAAEKLGSIELRVVPVHKYAETAAFRPHGFAGTASVYERSKKVGAHCVALGRAVRVPEGPHRRVKSTPLNGKAGPVARFVFRYRPAAILQAQGIMPPKGSQGANNPRARPARQPKKERGATSVDKQDRKPVKTEPGHKPRLGDVSGDVIDLSSDDDVPVVKREPRRQRALQHDPGDVIDLTLD